MSKEKVIDFYLNYSISVDVGIVLIIWVVNLFFPFVSFDFGTQTDNIAILSNLISIAISLAGFILAALTIIVAIKSNLSSTINEKRGTPLKLFFTPKNYEKIISVFRGSICELVAVALVSYIAWLSLNNFDVSKLFLVNVTVIVITFLSLVRSLLVLFRVMSLK